MIQKIWLRRPCCCSWYSGGRLRGSSLEKEAPQKRYASTQVHVRMLGEASYIVNY